MKMISRRFRGRWTLNGWLRRTRRSLRLLNTYLIGLKALNIVFTLQPLAIPKYLLLLQLVRIQGAFSFPDTFKAGKKQRRKILEEKEKETLFAKSHEKEVELSLFPPDLTAKALQPEIVREISPLEEINFAGLQKVVESAGLPSSLTIVTSSYQSALEWSPAVAVKTKTNFVLESMSWLKPFGHSVSSEKRFDLDDNTFEDENVEQQLGTQPATIDKSKIVVATSDEATIDEKSVPTLSTDLTLDESKESEILSSAGSDESSALPIFLHWTGMADFFESRDAPLFLAPLASTSLATRLQSVSIPVARTTGPIKNTRPTGIKSKYYKPELVPLNEAAPSPFVPVSETENVSPLDEYHAVWSVDHSPISSLIEKSIGSNIGALANVSVPILFGSRGTKAGFEQVIRPQLDMRDYSASRPEIESKGVDAKSAPGILDPYSVPFFIDLPFLAVDPRLSHVNWSHGLRITRKRTNLSVSNALKPDMVTLKEQVGSDRERSLEYSSDSGQEDHPIATEASALSMTSIEDLAAAPAALNLLKDLLIGPGKALVRIRGIDHYPRAGRGMVPFDPTRKSMMSTRGQIGAGHLSRFGPSVESSISSDTPRQIFMDISQKTNVPSLLPDDRQIDQPNGVVPLLPTFVQRRAAELLQDSDPTFEDRADILAGNVSFGRTDLETRRTGITTQEDLELEQLKAIRMRVHSIINEELRKYGFET